MQPEQTTIVPADKTTYEHNRDLLLSLLRHEEDDLVPSSGGCTLTISLERVLFDHGTNSMVPFDGPHGIEAVLAQVVQNLPDCEQEWHDGHLMGLRESTKDGRLPLRVTLEAGGQLVCTVGPAYEIADLRDALDRFDRAIHVASRALDCNYELLPEGYNSLVETPLDVSLVPRTKFTLLSAHLSQTGRYARDAMRCSCATHLSLGYTDERDALTLNRLAVALTPLLMFLTDNVRSFRGSGARRCPIMTRAIVWDEVDSSRCGIVPGTFDPAFSMDNYVDRLEELLPILFTDDDGETTSTGKKTLREIMEGHEFSRSEAQRMLHIALPYVRIDGRVELRMADALRPRLVASLGAFVKGLLCNMLSVDALETLFADVDETAVRDAIFELRVRGWNATVYGRRVEDLVGRLITIARSGLEDASERRMLESLAELWEFSLVPRDSFVQQEIKADRGW